MLDIKSPLCWNTRNPNPEPPTDSSLYVNSPLDNKDTWQLKRKWYKYTHIFLLIIVYNYPLLNLVVISKLFESTADMAEEERRILVAVDEGEESMHALSWCLKNLVFQNSKDTLILLYVKPPRVVYSAFDGTGIIVIHRTNSCLLYTSPSPRD